MGKSHATSVVRSGDGVRGICSCKQKQPQPVPTRQEAEDWCFKHEEQVRRAQADPGKKLSEPAYLEHLRKMAADTSQSARNRSLWAQLAEEQARRMKTGAAGPRGGIPQSPNAKYNTGVATEPLW